MYFWGKDAKYAVLDLYDSGEMAYFTAESYADPGVPIVIPLSRHDLQVLITLLAGLLGSYGVEDE